MALPIHRGSRSPQEALSADEIPSRTLSLSGSLRLDSISQAFWRSRYDVGPVTAVKDRVRMPLT
ncbi:hypothetical protein HPP92_027661 [Vanilla planifolia]|uniref:Uncharacterized protein n=1 Tax=Vanilla planifolia TaxID=51239 RepID=A0A835P926_VANPL|nr:hypothetical protein HPP92_027661 [Vanilla planifolia]